MAQQQDVNATLADMVDRILATGRQVKADVGSGDLQSQAKALLTDGEDKLAEMFNIADTPDARADFRKHAKWAAGLGGLAVLLSSRSAKKRRNLVGVSALGALAFAAFKKNGDKLPTSKDEVMGLLRGDAQGARARALLTAMVAAAQVDGEITDAEREAILREAGDGIETLTAILNATPNAEDVAKLATSAQAGREIYAVSARVADGLNERERRYLDDLAIALELDPDTAAHIETDVRL